MIIGIPVYEGVDLLDVAGPYEMFSWVDMSRDFRPVVISQDGKPVTTVNKLRFEAHYSFANAPHVDVLWVPGGDPKALRRIMTDPKQIYLNYIRGGSGPRRIGSAPSAKGRCWRRRRGCSTASGRRPTGSSSTASRNSRTSTSSRERRASFTTATASRAAASPPGSTRR